MGVKVNNSTNELGYLFRAERGAERNLCFTDRSDKNERTLKHSKSRGLTFSGNIYGEYTQS